LFTEFSAAAHIYQQLIICRWIPAGACPREGGGGNDGAKENDGQKITGQVPGYF